MCRQLSVTIHGLLVRVHFYHLTFRDNRTDSAALCQLSIYIDHSLEGDRRSVEQHSQTFSAGWLRNVHAAQFQFSSSSILTFSLWFLCLTSHVRDTDLYNSVEIRVAVKMESCSHDSFLRALQRDIMPVTS